MPNVDEATDAMPTTTSMMENDDESVLIFNVSQSMPIIQLNPIDHYHSYWHNRARSLIACTAVTWSRQASLIGICVFPINDGVSWRFETMITECP